MNFDIRKELNDKQLDAALTLKGPVLIIAGAGSGKTRMITFRIAHMLNNGIHQSNILALTFTNKAAREMAERIRSLTGKKLSNLTVSTFHAFGVKVLRKEIHRLGYRDNFSIYDESDKQSNIKEAARSIQFPMENLDLYELTNLFSGIKTGRIFWDDLTSRYKPLYQEYQELLEVYNAVDFDDLIVLPIRIFKEFPEVLQAYHDRFTYIMVDEFQDTSLIQYEMLRLLGIGHRNICVVGDDDQSIYSWRGANYQNIVLFEQDFPELKEIKLEQNYRSTGNILEAANELIANNTNRKEKALWTGAGIGKAIEIYYPDNETREGQFIAEMIRSVALTDGLKYHDVGVLVRTNSLTAHIEDSFLEENIPYKVTGGTSFFQRREIKDLIAYLRILANPEDDVNFLRIVNTPRRGIGKKTLLLLREVSDNRECSLYTAMNALRWAEDSPLSDRVRGELDGFLNLIDIYRERILGKKRKMAQALTDLVAAIDYWGYLIMENPKSEKAARWKYGNVTKFIDMLEKWENDEDNVDPNIFTYLNRISLINREEDEDEESGRVNLMTIHSAKGLEWDLVFLAGVEDGIIPHQRSVEEDPANIEEERRLFYVAITRAKQKLFITSCTTRRSMRDTIECSPSPFLEEIPSRLIENHKGEEPVAADAADAFFAKMKEQMQN